MNGKDHFFNRHRNLNLDRGELDRKWKVFQQEQEMMMFMEAARQGAQQAAAVASVGGGGGGGESIIPLPDLLLGQSYAWYYRSLETSTWWVKTINFETGITKSTDLEINSNDYEADYSNSIVNRSGFIPVFYNNDTSQYTAFFIDLDANVVGSATSGDLNFNNYIEDGLLAYVTDSDDPDGYSIWIFDGKNLNKYSFLGATGWNYGSNAGSLTQDLSVPAVIYYPDKTESYLLRRNGQAVNISDSIDLDNYPSVCSFTTNFIAALKWDDALSLYSRFIIVSQEGKLILDQDITGLNINDWYTFDYYSSSVFLTGYNSDDTNTPWTVLHHDGTSYKTYTHQRYNPDTDSVVDTNTFYNNPDPADDYTSLGQTLLITFYENNSYSWPWESFGKLDAAWISPGKDFQEHNVGSEIYTGQLYSDTAYATVPMIYFTSGATASYVQFTTTGAVVNDTDYQQSEISYISSSAFGDSVAVVFDLTGVANDRQLNIFNGTTLTHQDFHTVNWEWWASSQGLIFRDDADSSHSGYALGSNGAFTTFNDAGIGTSINVYDYPDQNSRTGYMPIYLPLVENMETYGKLWVLTPTGMVEGGSITWMGENISYGGYNVFTNIYQDGDSNYNVEVFSLATGALLYAENTEFNDINGNYIMKSPEEWGDYTLLIPNGNVNTIVTTLTGLVVTSFDEPTTRYAINEMDWYWW